MAISQRDLEQKLGLGSVDGGELAFLLSQRFQRAQHTSDRQIDYPDPENLMISLRYDKRNVLNAIEPGKLLTEDAANSIAQEVETKLLSPSPQKIASMILFSNVPVEGYWRYRDKLVICRAPDKAPRPTALTGKHPLMLELSYSGADDGFTNNMRRERASQKWALMLTLLVPGIQVPPRVEFNRLWVVPLEIPLPPGPHTSIEAQEIYLFPRDKIAPSVLSDRGELPEIQLIREVPTTVGPGQVLVLPESIEQCLDIFDSLDLERNQKILRAAFWLDYSDHVWRLSKSASYQALIQAVEVLIDMPKDQPRCIECDRTTGAGPTALFAKFLDDYAPASSDLEPARKELYSLRSSLAHGNTLLYMDQGVVYNWYGPKSPHEHMLISNARVLCRRAIVNWLMEQSHLADGRRASALQSSSSVNTRSKTADSLLIAGTITCL